MPGMRPAYVLVIGHGRSGTNWLLDLLDLSRETHCRNEANGEVGGALTALPAALFEGEADAVLDERWDAAVRETSLRLGQRDHWSARPKDHLYAIPRRLGLATLVKHPRGRRLLGVLMPSLRTGEFRLPRAVGSEARLARALPVLKLAAVPGWAVWVLRNRPRALVLHIVRHPGGFLNSWRNRYYLKRNVADVAKANIARLSRLVELQPAWSPIFGPIEGMSGEEAELWYWRYATETIENAGAGSPGFHRIVYERLATETVAVTRGVYAACGLAWTPEIERGIAAMAAESESIADAWHEKLSVEHRALVEKVLDGSKLRSLWGT